jgi:hypothetical protein
MEVCSERIDLDGSGIGVYPPDLVSTRKFPSGLHLPLEYAGLCAYGQIDLKEKVNEFCLFGVLIMDKGETLEDILKRRELTEDERSEFLLMGCRLNYEATVLRRVFMDQSAPNVLMLRGKLHVCRFWINQKVL